MTQSIHARQSIDSMFELLATRLDPIIAHVLAPHLGGVPWTRLLEERDRLQGRAPAVYVRTDPQAQLKVLTERLGALGYPFDDHTRTVSVLGGELRIVRNRWAHHGELSVLDAWRTSDFVVRLLDRLGDVEGAEAATRIREEAFVALAAENGVAAHAAPVESTDAEGPVADATFAVRSHSPQFELVSPPAPPLQLNLTGVVDPSVLLESAEAAERNASIVGSDVDTFEPWIVVPVGRPEVVDGLPRKAMKEQVRAVAAEIIDFEGPIQLKRAAQLTAASFGIQRLREQREKRIVYQIGQIEGVTVDRDKFVWPRGIDPTRWRGYRTNDSGVARDFLAISPIEIANAMRALDSMDERDVDRATLRIFGKSRLTAAFKAHLEKARGLL